MPGAVVLAGFPALPWGQLGKGPVPACLDALLETGVPTKVLESMMDFLFNMSEEEYTPTMLMHGGRLRPAVEWSFATLIM